MKIYLLDMGNERYGDCIVCVGDRATLMIDGGHLGDFQGRAGSQSIPDQLRGILGAPPFRPDLLIVTHCHSDHIGCLPEMVGQGMLAPKAVLAADPDLGFGGRDGSGGAGDAMEDAVVAALHEEPWFDAVSDQEVAEFIQDAANLQQRYRGMLDALKSGADVILYRGVGDAAAAEQLLRPLNLKIHGPDSEHLGMCARAIQGFVTRNRQRVRRARSSDNAASRVQIYRNLATDGDGGGMPSMGAPLNDQSIVVSVGEDGHKALLTGDMQFAQAEQPGLDDKMAALRQTVVQGGPYAFVKLPHHASYNGTDEGLLTGLGSKVLAMSGGRDDRNHPDPSVLKLLAQTDGLTWARTDRNGLITCDLGTAGTHLTPSKGELNDATPNTESDVPRALSIPSASVVGTLRTSSAPDGLVEVTARIPHVRTRVSIIIDVDPGVVTTTPPDLRNRTTDQAVQPIGGQPLFGSQAGSYRMRDVGKRLLFVTNASRLTDNIGKTEATLALSAIRAAGHDVFEPSDPDAQESLYREIRGKLSGSQITPDGVVVLGGYDVLPSSRMDVLDARLRTQVGQSTNDADNFIVWSDQRYGDLTGDQMADIPVSRITDGRSPTLVRAALTGQVQAEDKPFGIRNDKRPFAEVVYAAFGTTAPSMLTSQPQEAQAFQPLEVDGDHHYMMLHGSYLDCTRFWGEQSSSGYVEAFNVRNVPASSGGVVFAGCCWGALTVNTTAASYTQGDRIAPLPPEMSIALSFLKAGVKAFVGCTGSHYSPLGNQPDHFGGPMHVAFWERLLAGEAPASALMQAKKAYVAGIPHGLTKPTEFAIEYKILRQFTCLGLGW